VACEGAGTITFGESGTDMGAGATVVACGVGVVLSSSADSQAVNIAALIIPKKIIFFIVSGMQESLIPLF
jgi:hypothetical protein